MADKTATFTEKEVKLLLRSLEMTKAQAAACPESVFYVEDLEQLKDPDNPQDDPIWQSIKDKLTK